MSGLPTLNNFEQFVNTSHDNEDDFLESLFDVYSETQEDNITSILNQHYSQEINQSIFLNLAAMSKYGLAKDEMSHFYSIYSHLLQFLGTNSLASTLLEARKELDAAVASSQLRQSSIQPCLSFLYKTIFQHFHLYKYFILHNRDIKGEVINLDISTPQTMTTYSLSQAKTETVWKYLDTYTTIQRLEDEKLAQLQHEKENKLCTLKENIPFDEADDVDGGSMIDKIIKSVIEKNMALAEVEIACLIAEVDLKCSTKFECTALPRPQILGSPPRFKTQPSLKLAKQGTSGSTTRKSATSSSSRGNSAAMNKAKKSS